MKLLVKISSRLFAAAPKRIVKFTNGGTVAILGKDSIHIGFNQMGSYELRFLFAMLKLRYMTFVPDCLGHPTPSYHPVEPPSHELDCRSLRGAV